VLAFPLHHLLRAKPPISFALQSSLPAQPAPPSCRLAAPTPLTRHLAPTGDAHTDLGRAGEGAGGAGAQAGKKGGMRTSCSSLMFSTTPRHSMPTCRCANEQLLSCRQCSQRTVNKERICSRSRATRATRNFGMCPSFKDHSLSPRAKPQLMYDSQLSRRCTAAPSCRS
jgi:hypothetical protein